MSGSGLCRGPGHGDSRMPVLAPMDVPADFLPKVETQSKVKALLPGVAMKFD